MSQKGAPQTQPQPTLTPGHLRIAALEAAIKHAGMTNPLASTDGILQVASTFYDWLRVPAPKLNLGATNPHSPVDGASTPDSGISPKPQP